MSPVTFVGSLCKIHAVGLLCSKIADVHGIDVHDVRTWTFVYFRENVRFLLHNTRDVTRGARGTIPRGPNHCGGPNTHNNVISTFFKTIHLLPKDLSFEQRDAERISFPRRHLTSLRPCTSWLSSQNSAIYLQNTCPSVANYQSQTI